MTLSFSRNLAVIIGILLPIAETVRRWSTWQEYPPALFDDYIAGALLLYGAWRSFRNAHEGQKYLVTGWAFACGLGYASFFSRLKSMNNPDPAPIPHVWLTAILGVGWVLVILALIGSLRGIPEKKSLES